MTAPDRIPLRDRLKEAPQMRGFPFLRHHRCITTGAEKAWDCARALGERPRTAWLRGSVCPVVGDVRRRLRRHLQGRVVRGFLIDPRSPLPESNLPAVGLRRLVGVGDDGAVGERGIPLGGASLNHRDSHGLTSWRWLRLQGRACGCYGREIPQLPKPQGMREDDAEATHAATPVLRKRINPKKYKQMLNRTPSSRSEAH